MMKFLSLLLFLVLGGGNWIALVVAEGEGTAAPDCTEAIAAAVTPIEQARMALVTDVEHFKTTIHQLEDRIGQLNGEIQTLADKNALLAKELETAQAEKASLQKQLEDVHEGVDRAMETAKKAKAEAKEKEDAIRDATSKLDGAQIKIRTLTADLTKVKADLAAFKEMGLVDIIMMKIKAMFSKTKESEL